MTKFRNRNALPVILTISSSLCLLLLGSSYYSVRSETRSVLNENVEMWGPDLSQALADGDWLSVARIGKSFALLRLSAFGITHSGRVIFSYPSENSIAACVPDYQRTIKLYGVVVGKVKACTDPKKTLVLAVKSPQFIFSILILCLLAIGASLIPLLNYKHSLLRVMSILEARAAEKNGNLPEIEHDAIARRLVQLVEQINQNQIEMQNQINELQKSKELHEISRQIAHDIRSPLSALNVMAASLEGMSEQHRAMLRTVIERINSVAQSLLDKTRNENRSPVVSFDPGPAVLEIIGEKKALLLDSKVSIRHDFNLPTPVRPRGRVEDFKRVISNLLTNSIEAIEDSGSIVVALRLIAGKTIIEVNDTGRGIPSEIVPLLGERGASFGKQNKTSGSGLGLFHAKRFSEQNGGDFEIISKEGLGTTVRLTLLS